MGTSLSAQFALLLEELASGGADATEECFGIITSGEPLA